MTDVPARYYVDDPTYDPTIGARLSVRLDGVLQRHVIGYDIEAGEVTRCKYGDDGKPFVEDEEVAVEVVTGRVEVAMAPAEASPTPRPKV